MKNTIKQVTGDDNLWREKLQKEIEKGRNEQRNFVVEKKENKNQKGFFS